MKNKFLLLMLCIFINGLYYHAHASAFERIGIQSSFQAETFAKPHFLIVTKHKFLNFQLVIFLEFVNSEILQRFQAA